MEVVRAGTGPPLLLVHGIGMSAAAFADVVPLLADRFAVVAVDLPGFGASAPLPGAPTLPALADACAALMAALGFADGTWAVAGNSLGGGIAVHLALLGRVRAACALSPVGFGGQGLERLHLHASIAGLGRLAGPLGAVVPRLPAAGRREALRLMAWHGERLAPERVRASFGDLERATALTATRRAAFRWRCPAWVGALPAPLTIAWGEHDWLLPTGPQSRRARERLPGATHVRIPDAGHLPAWDAPRATAEILAAAT